MEELSKHIMKEESEVGGQSGEEKRGGGREVRGGKEEGKEGREERGGRKEGGKKVERREEGRGGGGREEGQKTNLGENISKEQKEIFSVLSGYRTS